MSIKEKVDAMTKIIRMTPVPVLLASLESMINILHERGIDVVDWDDKSKKLVQFRIIGGKAYFFAASDNKESDKNGDSKE